ncbi:unnamed protein product [Amoebophrya sp. A25]|nr:unnamed protein product [Amoebophrya sp. A25]|eukprot:GSA25T00006572001.1
MGGVTFGVLRTRIQVSSTLVHALKAEAEAPPADRPLPKCRLLPKAEI